MSKKIIYSICFCFCVFNAIHAELKFRFDEKNILENGKISKLTVFVENTATEDIEIEYFPLWDNPPSSFTGNALTVRSLQDSVFDVVFISTPMYKKISFPDYEKSYTIPAKSTKKIEIVCDLRFWLYPRGKHKLFLIYQGEKKAEGFVYIE